MAGTLGDLLAASAARHPARDAVVLEGVHVPYAELESSANRIARSLRARGVTRGDRVGLWCPKSHAAIAALWGTLRSGAAYVPIDPGAPPARLATIARDAGLSALVVSPDRAAAAGNALAGLDSLRGLWVTGLPGSPSPAAAGAAPPNQPAPASARRAPWVPWAEVEAEAATAPGDPPTSDDLAYILYTSGSTGVPKGVVHTHASALAFIDWACSAFAMTEQDRVSNHAPFHFDLSTFDLFATAKAGAAVYPVPARAAMFPSAIAQLYTQERLTVWYETPSALGLLLRHGKLAERDVTALRVLLFAGEVMPVALLNELMALAPRARFANLYGPTETNVCTWHDVTAPAAPERPLPIGVPCSGDEAWVLDEELREVARGESGELWISGDSVMRGYWGDGERTERTLRTLTLGGAPRLAYRTGDLVRWNEDGVLLFHGRRDHQIKTRGYRVELGEIEVALHAHPEVAEAVVLALPDPEIGHRLKALVVARPEVPAAARANAAGLKDHCARTLPRYMVPEFIDFRDALPRTASGKVDRTALAAEEAAPRKDPA
jgi:amino acid adenylation domain-containing protein